MGDLHCLDAAKGDVLWKKDLLAEYKIRMPIWGITAAPLVEGNLLIVEIGGEEACIVAFDKADRRRKMESRSTTAPAMRHRSSSSKRAGACSFAGRATTSPALDPANGELLWKLPFKPTQMVLNVATPVVHDDRLFFTAFYDGSLMARLDRDKPAAEVVWRQQRHERAEHRCPALDHLHALFRR